MSKQGKCKGSDSKQVQAIINQPPSHTDPNGSYTGKPLDKNEIPTQDADDL